MEKVCGRVAYSVSEGERAVLGVEGTSVNGRAKMPESLRRAAGGTTWCVAPFQGKFTQEDN